MDVVGAHPGKEVALVSVQIDECLEAVLLAAVEEPVDGALLIGFQVIGVEVVEKIAADDLFGLPLAPQGIGDKSQVLVQGLFAVDHLKKADEAVDNIVLEVIIVADGYDVVGVHRKGQFFPFSVILDIGVFLADTKTDTAEGNGISMLVHKMVFSVHFIPFTSGIGKPVHIQRIAPEHTAYGVGNEGDDLIPHGADIAAAPHALRHIILAVKHTMHGDISVRHLRDQLVLEAIDVDEDAVEFLFVFLEL